MKKYTFTYSILAVIFCFTISNISAQIAKKQPHPAAQSLSSNWSTNPFDHQLFVVNQGQFDKDLNTREKVAFYTMLGKTKIYFTARGLVYRTDVSNAGKENGGTEAEEEKSKTLTPHYLNATWQGANSNVTLDAEDEQPYNYIYATGKNESMKVKVYKKLTYHNIYNGIDLVYTFPEGKEGIKYSVIVHPGADISQLKLAYGGDGDLSIDKDGNLIEHSTDEAMSDFTEHTPVSYYEDGGVANIQYNIAGRTEFFTAKNGYDKTRTLVIDPWTTTTTFTSYNAGYDIDYDSNGNVYVGGGYDPFQITKFNSSGVIQWTYSVFSTDNSNSGYDLTVWGDFAVDKHTGTVYVGEGFNVNGAWIEKINTSGVLKATYSGTTTAQEIWRMQYSAALGGIVLGLGGGNIPSNQLAILDTTVATLTPKNPLGTTSAGHDVCLMAIDPAGTPCYAAVVKSSFSSATFSNYLFSVPVPALTPYSYALADGFAFQEDASISYVDAVGDANSMNGMAASPNYLYMYDGKTLQQRNKSTGVLGTSITAGSSQYGEGGLAADGCDNVYVGVGSTLTVYNSSLTSISTSALTSTIYAIALGKNGSVVYVCGKGFVSQIANPVPTTSTASATPVNTACGSSTGSVTANLVSCGAAPSTITYAWSPGGQTSQSITGQAAGSYSVTITANSTTTYTATATVGTTPIAVTATTTSPSACKGDSATLTAGGALTYVWNTGKTSSAINVDPASATIYTVTGTGTAGCNATATVSVSPSKINITNSSPSICPNDSSVLTATGAATYVWSTSATNASITAKPTSTTTYSVVGISSGGCHDTATAVVTFVSTPAVSILPSAPTICAGSSVGLTASGASSYTWAPNNNITPTTGSSVTASPNATQTYTVTGTTSGCVGTKTVTVTINPRANIVISPGGGSVCSGSSITMHDTVKTAASYSWAPAAGLNQTTGISVIATPTANTTYTVYGYTALGCPSFSQPVTITVTPTPTVTIGPGAPTICPGNNVILTASGATTYAWTPNTNLTATTGASVTASPTATTTYSVTGTTSSCNSASATEVVTVASSLTVSVTPTAPSICAGSNVVLNGNGAATYAWRSATGLSCTSCSDPTATPTSTTTYTVVGSSGSCKDSAYVTVTINPLPTATITPSGSTTFCSGGSVGLTASGTATSYTWAPSTGLNVTTGTSVAANPTSTQTYTLTGLLGTCTATATVVVTVSPNPTVTATATPSTICVGGTTMLTGNGATTYAWTPNTNLTATTGTSVTASPTTTITYSVTGTTGTCTSSPTTVVVTVNPSLTVSVTPSAPSICAGSSVKITGNGATTYSWRSATGLSCTTCSNPTANPASTATYTVVGMTGSCADSAYVTVTIKPLPTATITPSGSTTFCSGGSVGLTASGTATSYTWAPSTGLSATTGTSVTASPTSTQTYILTGSLATGCTATATVVVTVNTTPTVTANAIPSTICAGGTTMLTVNNATTYAWSPNTNLTATTGTSVTASPTTTITYSVTGTTGTCTSAPSTVTITVNPVSATTITGKYTVCSGTADTLTAGGGTTYTWSTGATSTSIIVNPITDTTYWVSATNSGCSNAIDTVKITVNQLPAVSVSGHAHHTCGNADSLIAHATGAKPFTYNWTSGSTDSIAAVIINSTYSVTVKDTKGCMTTKSFAVKDSVPVIPICLVTVDSTSTKMIIIWNNPQTNSGIDSLFLYRDSVANNPIARFAVGAFSEFIDTTNGVNPNLHSYQYNLDGEDSCGQSSGGLTGYAKSIHLSISPNGCGYVLNWTKYNGYFTFTQYYIHRDSANMGWKTVDSVGTGTFTWTDPDCYSASTNVNYYIDVKDPDVCTPTASIIGPYKYLNITSSRSNSAASSLFTGVQQLVNSSSISVYPNPFTTATTIVFGSAGKHYVEVDDITGRKIEGMQCVGKQYELSGEGLAEGIYFIRAYDEGMNYVATAKIVVQ